MGIEVVLKANMPDTILDADCMSSLWETIEAWKLLSW